MTNSITYPKVLRPREAASYLQISLASFWRLVKRGELPKGIKLSTRCSVWRVEVLDNYIKRKEQASIPEEANGGNYE